MGIPVAELQRRVSSAEYAHWIAFYLMQDEADAKREGRDPTRIRKVSGKEARLAVGRALGVE